MSKQEVVIKSIIYNAALGYLFDKGFAGVPYPGITNATGSCEAVSNVFMLQEPRFQTLTQTVQLQLERDIILYGMPRMFSTNRSYRRDNKNWQSDGRHLNDFELLETEALDTDLNWLLCHCAKLLSVIFRKVLKSSSSHGLLTPKQHADLYKYYKKGFKIITYTEAAELLQIPWGTDLNSEMEQQLVNHYDHNLMVTHYPESIKFFNMLLTRDGLPAYHSRQTVDCVDVILKHSGESIGGSVREYDHDIIKHRLDTGIMMKQLKELKEKFDGKPEEVEHMFDDYLALFKNNRVKRSGMGMGFGRVAQFCLGSKDVVVF